ncbi:unnamed protein product [Rotaria magnacalcarata]|nr:unnamed protein product [Rotaria magnacalcarata]
MATIISAASLLGGPAEIYPYENISLCLAGIAWLIGTYSTANIFIPIFRRLGHISLYTYLEQRFSLSVRIVITSTFLIINTCFIPIILSGPSLALSQVTGLHIWFAIGSCGIICTLCTSVLYPLFVPETLGQYPGLTGLFIAGIMDASLSTISSGINSMATVIVKGIYKRIIVDHSMSRRIQDFVSKILSLLILFLTFIVSYLVDHILVITFQIAASFVPPILGIYLLGFFAPRVNSRVSISTKTKTIY